MKRTGRAILAAVLLALAGMATGGCSSGGSDEPLAPESNVKAGAEQAPGSHGHSNN